MDIEGIGLLKRYCMYSNCLVFKKATFNPRLCNEDRLFLILYHPVKRTSTHCTFADKVSNGFVKGSKSVLKCEKIYLKLYLTKIFVLFLIIFFNLEGDF